MQCNIFVASPGGPVLVALMLSVVIPTLNSASTLPLCFQGLFRGVMLGLIREVIVADGGSTDATIEIAEATGARVVEGGYGRGNQMTEGAAVARGDWLLFLHPATILQPGWENDAQNFIRSSFAERPRAASFRFTLDDRNRRSRLLETLVALRCRILALPFGEQGLLVPAVLYRQLGGYRRHALHEDVDFARRLGRRRIVMLRARATGSTARFHWQDNWRSRLRVLGALILYALRARTPLERISD